MLVNAAKIHRLNHWLYKHNIPILPKIGQWYLFTFRGCRIPPKTKIGAGTVFTAKGMGVILNGDEIIGQNCRIGHHVKMLRKNPYKDCAKIGNNVFISSGAVIMGNVIIEDNVIISANAVVTKSVPEGSVVGGIPAKIIGQVKDLDYNIFNNPKDKEGTAPFLTYGKI